MHHCINPLLTSHCALFDARRRDLPCIPVFPGRTVAFCGRRRAVLQQVRRPCAWLCAAAAHVRAETEWSVTMRLAGACGGACWMNSFGMRHAGCQRGATSVVAPRWTLAWRMPEVPLRYAQRQGLRKRMRELGGPCPRRSACHKFRVAMRLVVCCGGAGTSCGGSAASCGGGGSAPKV